MVSEKKDPEFTSSNLDMSQVGTAALDAGDDGIFNYVADCTAALSSFYLTYSYSKLFFPVIELKLIWTVGPLTQYCSVVNRGLLP